MSQNIADCEQELEKLQEERTRLVEENDSLRDAFGQLAERLNAELETQGPLPSPEWDRSRPPVPAGARLRHDRRVSGV